MGPHFRVDLPLQLNLENPSQVGPGIRFRCDYESCRVSKQDKPSQYRRAVFIPLALIASSGATL